jgi:hypothetical protein
MGENKEALVVIGPDGEFEAFQLDGPLTPPRLRDLIGRNMELHAARVDDDVCLYFTEGAPNPVASRLCGIEVEGMAFVFGVTGSTERALTAAELERVMKRLKTGEAPVHAPIQTPRDLTIGGLAAIQAGDGSHLMFLRPFVEAPGGMYATVEAAEKALEIWQRDPAPLKELLEQVMDAAERSGLMAPQPLTVEDLEDL